MNATQLFAVCTIGLALVVAAGPLEMPIGKVARQPAGGDWLGCLQADEWALGLLANVGQ